MDCKQLLSLCWWLSLRQQTPTAFPLCTTSSNLTPHHTPNGWVVATPWCTNSTILQYRICIICLFCHRPSLDNRSMTFDTTWCQLCIEIFDWGADRTAILEYPLYTIVLFWFISNNIIAFDNDSASNTAVCILFSLIVPVLFLCVHNSNSEIAPVESNGDVLNSKLPLS